MARNHNFFFDADRTPRARGPVAEKTLMSFLEADVQGSDHVCRDLMDDLIAVEDGSDDEREFIGNANRVVINREGVLIEPLDHGSPGTVAVPDTMADPAPSPAPATTAPPADAPAAGDHYRTGCKHFREVLEDWEAFILDDGTADLGDDPMLDDEFV